jgi:hypothetical protein
MTCYYVGAVWWYEFKAYSFHVQVLYVTLHTIVPGLKTSLVQKTFWFVTTTMASSGFGPNHGLWHKDTPTKHIDITPTSGVMTHALGVGILAPQPKIYHTYSTAIFFGDFYLRTILR